MPIMHHDAIPYFSEKPHHGVRVDQRIEQLLYQYYPDDDLFTRKSGNLIRPVFLDVGACHPIHNSNSHHFRLSGWNVIAIEPDPQYYSAYERYKFPVERCAVGERLGVTNLAIHHPDIIDHKGGGSHITKEPAKQEDYDDRTIENIRVQLCTLDYILLDVLSLTERGGIVDVVDIDIEGGELNALFGFNLKRWKPKVLCIEDWGSATSEILKYMNFCGYDMLERHGYDTYWIPSEVLKWLPVS